MKLINRIKKNFNRKTGCDVAMLLIAKAEQSGISRELLSQKSGISTTSFLRWESGNVEPHPYKLAKLQDAIAELITPTRTRAFVGQGYAFSFRVDSSKMGPETSRQLEEIKEWITFLQKTSTIPPV